MCVDWTVKNIYSTYTNIKLENFKTGVKSVQKKKTEYTQFTYKYNNEPSVKTN